MNKTIFPGIGLVIGIALIGRYIEKILPIHIVSASVMALFIGMSLNRFIKKEEEMLPPRIDKELHFLQKNY